MKLQASENNLNSLKTQFSSAVAQAEDAKKAVQQNAMRLQEVRRQANGAGRVAAAGKDAGVRQQGRRVDLGDDG